MGKFMRQCCRRETYAILVGITYLLFEILSLALPWYGIAATKLPAPWDTMTAAFYWGGFEGLYSPPLVADQRTYNIPWASMVSTMPKDVYMSSMAMAFLGLFSMICLCVLIFVGFVLPQTERTIQIMFFGWFKWVVVSLCYANFIVSLLSWTVFFAFPAALSSASICPGTTAYNPPPIPYHNTTIYFDPMFCDSFANSRAAFDAAQWVWGPSLGWIFSIVCFVLSSFVLFIMLSVPPTREGDYQNIK